jgi:hypothetical protein
MTVEVTKCAKPIAQDTDLGTEPILTSDEGASHPTIEDYAGHTKLAGMVSPHITLPEAADYCRVSASLIRKALREGWGPNVARVGRRLIFRSDNLDAWLKQLTD